MFFIQFYVRTCKEVGQLNRAKKDLRFEINTLGSESGS